MICPVDENGWCGRHRCWHRGPSLALALRDDEQGEKYRLLWDRRGPLPHELTAPDGTQSQAPEQPFGLGDAVEAALSSVGVTKARVAAWLGSCWGCGRRQERLNRLGRWVAGASQAGLERAREELDRLLA